MDNMLLECGIYQIVSPNNSFYIGMTSTSFDERWKNHLKTLRNGTHRCKGLQRAYNKYGENALSFEIIQVMTNKSQQEILEAELFWWKKYKSWGINVYNGEPTGTGSVKHTVDTKARIAKALRDKSVLLKCTYKACDIEFSGKNRKYCSTRCKNLDVIIKCMKCELPFSSASGKRKECYDCLKPSLQINSEIKDYIVKIYSDGLSLRQISHIVSASHITVRNILIDSNVKLRNHSSNNRKLS